MQEIPWEFPLFGVTNLLTIDKPTTDTWTNFRQTEPQFLLTSCKLTCPVYGVQPSLEPKKYRQHWRDDLVNNNYYSL